MKARIIVFLLMIFVFVPTALAQTGGGEGSPGGSAANSVSGAAEVPIHKDSPVTVHLDGTTPVDLSYKSAGDEIVSITARSLEAEDVLDPVLTIFDASGATIASNDDHRTSRTDLAPRDSLVADLNLSDAGRYVVEVASFDANAQGDVEVLVTAGNPDATPEGDQGMSQVINDHLQDNTTYTHDFSANEGEVVTITVRATDNQIDPKVSLVDSSGAEVASNDDHDANDPSLGPYDSQILDFTIPKTDTYTIEITGFAGIGGTFELSILRGGGPAIPILDVPTQPPPVLPTPAPAQSTQVIEGTVKPNDVYTYQLEAQAGEVYTITVQATSSSFDPRVSIYFNNSYVIDNDDYGSTDPNLQSTDSRIYDWIVKDSGSYEVDVRGYQDSSGDFKMTIERVATGAPTGVPSEQVELGTVKTGEPYSFNFDAQAGDWVTITVRGLTQGFDPYLQLLSADGTVLLDNDDNGSGGDLGFYDSRIPNYHITVSGTYTIEVTGVNGGDGSFGVTIGTLH